MTRYGHKRGGQTATLLPAAATLLLLIFVAGCGFHLRGAVEVPPELNPMYVQAPGGSLLAKAIQNQLAGGSVRLAQSSKDAKVTLRILSETRSNRVAAVDRNAKVLAYELHYVVRWDVLGADGKERIAAQTMDLVRNFDNPDVEVLGKQQEQEMIYTELAADAADRILMRMRAVLLKRG
jgi:LPS-assembly lipoprotein